MVLCGWPRSTQATWSESIPAPSRRPEFDTRGAVRGLAVVDGDIWVASGAVAVDVHRGGTLRVAAGRPSGQLQRARPRATSTTAQRGHAVRVVYDSLLAYHYTSADPQVFVPDLATSVPEPTEGGRTYTFNLRPGIRYSTGELVKASDLVRGVQRALRASADRPDFYAGIVGGQACIDDVSVVRLAQGHRGGRRRRSGDVPPRGARSTVPLQADAPGRPDAAGDTAAQDHLAPTGHRALPDHLLSPRARRSTLDPQQVLPRVVGRSAAGTGSSTASPGSRWPTPARQRTP